MVKKLTPKDLSGALSSNLKPCKMEESKVYSVFQDVTINDKKIYNVKTVKMQRNYVH